MITSPIQFRPSRVEGLPDVDEVRITPQQLEVRSAGQWRAFPFLSFGRGREIASRRVPVGHLRYSKDSYADSHFVFYTDPQITIYMPTDGPTNYPDSVFWRVQEMLRDAGLRLYEDGPPRLKPVVLNPSPLRTMLYVLAVLAFAWLYGLSGSLPGRAGEIARHHLLSNPRNPAIGLAFMLPATLVPIILGVRHGRSIGRVAVIVAFAYGLALVSEWSLRTVIHPWAPIERPPIAIPFWTARRFVNTFIFVVITAIMGASWRRAHLEPIVRPAAA